MKYSRGQVVIIGDTLSNKGSRPAVILEVHHSSNEYTIAPKSHSSDNINGIVYKEQRRVSEYAIITDTNDWVELDGKDERLDFSDNEGYDEY